MGVLSKVKRREIEIAAEAAAAVDKIQLEEMDWQTARDQARELIRVAKMQEQMARASLERAERELRRIWDNLEEEERIKRYKDVA